MAVRDKYRLAQRARRNTEIRAFWNRVLDPEFQRRYNLNSQFGKMGNDLTITIIKANGKTETRWPSWEELFMPAIQRYLQQSPTTVLPSSDQQS